MSFHLLRPYWLLLFIPVICFVWLFLYRDTTKNPWQQVCDSHLLPYLMVHSSIKTIRFFEWFWLLILSMIILALTGPSFKRMEVPVYQTNQAIIWVQDMSSQMLVKDILPDRLTRVKYKFRDLMNTKNDNKYGFVIFAKEAHIVTPVTRDKEIILEMMQNISPKTMPVDGFNPKEAIEQAINLLKQSHVERGLIIVCTPGPIDAETIKYAQNVKNTGYKISVLGVGNKEGAPVPFDDGYLHDQHGKLIMSKLDESSLMNLARAGGGSYSSLTIDDNDLQNLIINSWHGFDITLNEKMKADEWADQGYWLLWLIFPLFLACFRRGWFEALMRR